MKIAWCIQRADSFREDWGSMKWALSRHVEDETSIDEPFPPSRVFFSALNACACGIGMRGVGDAGAREADGRRWSV